MAYGMMDNMYYGLGGGMMGGVGMLLYMAIIAFVFSLIFWYTYKLVVKDERRR